MIFRNTKQRIPLLLVLMPITAITITILGLVFKQNFWRMAPLYISLVIAFLQSQVNRFAPLIGAFNSLLYATVYFSFKLYASAVYSLALSCPLQFITFLRWRHRAYKRTTVLKKLSTKARLLVLTGFIVTWTIIYMILSQTESRYLIFDNTVTLIGILSTVLMMLSYIEYAPLMVVGNLCSLALYITMIPEAPGQVTYLVYTIYSFTSSIFAILFAKRTYAEINNIENRK